MNDTLDLNDDLPWSEMDLIDLRYGIAHRESFAEIAAFICRRESDVKAKAIELGLVEDATV
jgi:hypothetical protein